MRKVMLFVMLSLMVWALVGCGEQGGEQAASDAEVKTTPDISVTGEVVPAVWAGVSAQKGGTVLEVLVEPDDEVAAGDVLVRLDATDAELMVQQAEAALAISWRPHHARRRLPRPRRV
jgi:multidrug resistance efflux pump